MAANKSMSMTSLFMIIALLFAVLLFGTWYRNEAFQNAKKPTAEEMKKAQLKATAYLASNKQSTQNPSLTTQFQTALDNILKNTGLKPGSKEYAAQKSRLYSMYK